MNTAGLVILAIASLVELGMIVWLSIEVASLRSRMDWFEFFYKVDKEWEAVPKGSRAYAGIWGKPE